MGQNNKRKGEYSNSLVALAAIWRVLRRYATPERPLSVKEIWSHLPEEYSDSDAVPPDDSTVASRLRRLADSQLDTFPYRLRCMARTSTPLGETKYIPYHKYYDKLDDKDLGNNNRARYYYLEPVLTHDECQMLAELVRTSPRISTDRARVLLSYLNRLDRSISTYLPDHAGR